MSENRKGGGMKRLIAVCMLMWLGIGTAAQSDAPYIYYYSRLLEGWVIERADGTDSRLFAQGMMPRDHLAVWERGWSPSGEWFTWLSAPEYLSGGAMTFYSLWLVNIDGSRLPLFRLMEGFTDAYWAADADVLYLVAGSYSDDVVVYRFDVATQQIEMQTGDEIEPRPAETSTGGTETENSHISPDGRYSIGMHMPVLTDSQTGAEVQMRRFSGYAQERICGVNWHPGGEWLIRDDIIVYAGSGCSGGFVAANVTGTVQRELGLCHRSSGVCANWLPAQVTSRLSPGLPHSVVPEPLLTLQYEGDMKAVGWRQDGTALAAYEETRTDSGVLERVLIWTFQDGEAVLTDVFEVDYCYQEIHFGCEIEWSPDETKIALTDDYTTQIIDSATGAPVLKVEQSFAGWRDTGEPVLADGEGDADYHPAQGLLARTVDPEGERWFDTVQILEAATGNVLHTYATYEGNSVVIAVSFLPDGKSLAMLEYGDQPRLWNFTRDEWLRLESDPGDFITDLTASGAYIIGYGRETLVYVWDAATGDLVTRLNRYGWGVALSPDGRSLATAGGGGVFLWDMADVLAP